MIQDIAPLKLDNQYAHKIPPAPDSRVCLFRGSDLYLSIAGEEIDLPEYAAVRRGLSDLIYLFSIGGTAYFAAETSADPALEGFAYANVRAQRAMRPRDTVYAIMTAWHLHVWYRDNRFCGRCGSATRRDEKLRMLSCPACGNMIFPKICPAIIAGVINGDKILLTKYSGRAHKSYALIAGFCEIGETAEETVAREVMEEAGVRVKNIRYFATQPWGVDCDLLIGYFADLDGNDKITMDESELSLAGWYCRDQMDVPADEVSLTNTMIRAFIEGKIPR